MCSRSWTAMRRVGLSRRIARVARRKQYDEGHARAQCGRHRVAHERAAGRNARRGKFRGAAAGAVQAEHCVRRERRGRDNHRRSRRHFVRRELHGKLCVGTQITLTPAAGPNTVFSEWSGCVTAKPYVHSRSPQTHRSRGVPLDACDDVHRRRKRCLPIIGWHRDIHHVGINDRQRKRR